MRIAHLADISAVIHIHSPDEIIVALPADLSRQDILGLASLILSSEEYEKLAAEFPAPQAN